MDLLRNKDRKESRQPSPIGTIALIAVTSLLACEACPRTGPESTVRDEPVDSGPTLCTLDRVRPLPASRGHGPVFAVATEAGVGVLLNGGTTETELSFAELSTPALEPILSSELRADDTGPLLAQAIGRSGSSIAAVGQQEGGRRSYYFSRASGGAFAQVEAPSQSVLSRRTQVRLVAPRVGAGIQVISHVSGATEIRVGRLAGGLLVMRPIEVPQQIASPAGSAGPAGGLVLFGAERIADGERRLVVREVAADGTVLRASTVAQIAPGQRVDQLQITWVENQYWVAWQVWEGSFARYDLGIVDETTLVATLLDPIVAGDGSSVISLALMAQADHTTLVWTEGGAGDKQLMVAVDRGVAPREVESIRSLADGNADGLTLVPVGSNLAIFWRQVANGDSDGPVVAGILSCH